MKTLKFLNTQNLFLVEFHSKSSGCIFSNNDDGILGELIDEYGKNGILQIRRYNPVTMKFDRINKKLVEQLFSWDVYSTQQLKKANYIK